MYVLDSFDEKWMVDYPWEYGMSLVLVRDDQETKRRSPGPERCLKIFTTGILRLLQNITGAEHLTK